MNISIAIAGSGDITIKHAEALLTDFTGGKEFFAIVPKYISSDFTGLRTVIDVIEKKNYPSIIRVKKSVLVSNLIEQVGDRALFVLGTDGLESEIRQAQEAGIPVLDMTKGLFQVTVPLDGSESHANEVSETPEGEELSEEIDLVRIDPDEFDRRRAENMRLTLAPASKSFYPYGTEETGEEYFERRVKEIVMQAIGVHVAQYHNGVPMEEPKVEITGTNFTPGAVIDYQPKSEVVVHSPEPNYYKSATGKLRPIGRSKPRPKETPVYLTQEEIDAL